MTVFIDRKWEDEFTKAFREVKEEVLLMAPFIQEGLLRQLLRRKRVNLRVITRYSLSDFHEGVSDINALKYLLERNAAIRGVKNLHSKVYLFDGKKAFVTSANLTQAALTRNQEFGANKNLLSRTPGQHVCWAT